MRVDEAQVRRGSGQLRAQLSDVDVDRAVVGAERALPDRVEELLARDDAPFALCERGQQGELARRQVERAAAYVDTELVGPDLELPHMQCRFHRRSRLAAIRGSSVIGP